MNQMTFILFLLLTLIATAGCTSTSKPASRTITPTPPVEERYRGPDFAGEKLTIVATVEAVDLASRQVTLRGPSGKAETIVAGEEVRNLPQVEVGDQVVIEYYQGLALALTPADTGISKLSDKASLSRAQPGEKPAGVIVRTVEVNATVVALDKDAETVTLRGPRRTVTLNVADAVDLNQVNVGDEVRAVYDQALAISVQPAP